MAGVTHPFFGNQYTDGGYVIGSFKFPEGLTREVGEKIAQVAMPLKTSTSPTYKSTPLKLVSNTETKYKWVVPAIIIATVSATGGYIAYKHFKKKGIIKIPNVGVCEFCGEPLTGAKLNANDNNLYIVCKKCGEKNFARLSNDEISENLHREDGRI